VHSFTYTHIYRSSVTHIGSYRRNFRTRALLPLQSFTYNTHISVIGHPYSHSVSPPPKAQPLFFSTCYFSPRVCSLLFVPLKTKSPPKSPRLFVTSCTACEVVKSHPGVQTLSLSHTHTHTHTHTRVYVQFATYEEIKKVFRLYNDGTEHLSTVETLAASSLSKVHCCVCVCARACVCVCHS